MNKLTTALLLNLFLTIFLLVLDFGWKVGWFYLAIVVYVKGSFFWAAFCIAAAFSFDIKFHYKKD